MKKENPLDRHLFYRPFRKLLLRECGVLEGCAIWEEAGRELAGIVAADPGVKEHNGALVVPAAALYRVLTAHGRDAKALLNAFGEQMGAHFAGFVHGLTSIPGVDRLLWRNVDTVMRFMSGPDLGYRRRIVSEPPAMFGVDILSCPYHELAKALGAEKAVLCICRMDKRYMQGFRHIRYERTTAVSEGAECCDYRLRYDRNKE